MVSTYPSPFCAGEGPRNNERAGTLKGTLSEARQNYALNTGNQWLAEMVHMLRSGQQRQRKGICSLILKRSVACLPPPHLCTKSTTDTHFEFFPIQGFIYYLLNTWICRKLEKEKNEMGSTNKGKPGKRVFGKVSLWCLGGVWIEQCKEVDS